MIRWGGHRGLSLRSQTLSISTFLSDSDSDSDLIAS